MENGNYKKRIVYLDYLRVTAILGVLLNHVSANWEKAMFPNSTIALIYNAFGRIGVPLFLMLTGVLLLDNRLIIKEFIKRRYPRVIKPFLFWMSLLIIYTMFVLLPSILRGNVLSFIITSYLSDRWYVWMILGVYLIIPIISSFIKSFKMKGVEYFFIIWLITTGLISLSVVFDFSLNYLDLVIFSGPMGYLILGYYLHNKEFNISPRKIVNFSLIVFIVMSFLKFLILNQEYINPYLFRYMIFTTKSRLEIDTVSIFQVAAIFLVFKHISEVKSGIYNTIHKFANKKLVLAFIISMSQASYGIYLNHYFITNTLKFLKFPFTILPSIIVVPILTITVLLFAYSIIMVLNKIPVINKLSGYH